MGGTTVVDRYGRCHEAIAHGGADGLEKHRIELSRPRRSNQGRKKLLGSTERSHTVEEGEE